MKASLISSQPAKRRKAMALVMVVTTVALMSMLIVAIFSLTRTEYKATQNFVAARSAKQLADFAVAITQAQLQNAQNTSTAANDRTTHATQPGMARVYNAIGGFVRAHKLYSSSQMVITSTNEADIFSAANQVPQDWNGTANKARYVDLNEPSVRPGLKGGTTAVFFPIIDPRAAFTGTNQNSGQTMVAVEGFTYDSKTPTITGGGGQVSYNEVVLPSQAAKEPDKLRLPMPVEWIYVLQDGTTGALDSTNKFMTSQPGKEPSSTNPIVGRVAFWADDESCKININTASEPTFFSPPYFYHQRDSKWANFPGASGEYQRYPGHPATVALSAVVAPGISLDPFAPGANVTNIVQTKELIYGLMPKIATGGSKAGTRPFVNDDFSSSNGELAPAVSGDLANARKERLFASVDEMLFQDDLQNGNYGANGRIAASVTIPGQSNRFLLDHDSLERSRFFLTAHSRAPEFSIHGLPRVAMWPVSDEGQGDRRRTSFDNMIALCATLRSGTTGAAVDNSYIFRRAEPHSATYDVTGSTSGYGSSVGLSRNSKLMDYLYAQMSGLQFPRTSALGSSGNFADKYSKQNAAQLVVQFFDYIRSTNLYDGVLARDNDASSILDSNGNINVSGTTLYDKKDDLTKVRTTYTEQRSTPKAGGSLSDGTRTKQGNNILSDNAGVLPGHGQVTPARWEKDGQTYQGFGRMFTLSEIGFQFICTADGKNDELFPVTCGSVISGGGSAPKSLATKITDEGPSGLPAEYLPSVYPPPPAGTLNPLGFQRWYSNFPPLTDATGTLYGCDPTDPLKLKHPSRHPGYFPNNWNFTLDPNVPLSDGTQGKPAQKRVQAMLMLETFCPMLGWTKFHPEWAIVIRGKYARSVALDGVKLFPTTRDIIIKSNTNLYESSNVYSLGGHAGPTAMSGGRSVAAYGVSQMGDDTDPYVSGNARTTSTSRYIPDAPGHTGLNNWGLVSAFVTVNRNGPMQLTFEQRNWEIEIYDKHADAGDTNKAVQIIQINFDDMTLPTPALVYSGERRMSQNGPPQSLPVNRNEINYWWDTDSFGRLTWRRSLQAPHWWCFNRMGCLGRMQGTVRNDFNGTTQPVLYSGLQYDQTYDDANDQLTLGRLDTKEDFNNAGGGGNSTIGLIPPESPKDNNKGNTQLYDEQGNPWSGSDVIRTYVPAVGDYRLIAARRTVPASMWMRHPVWQQAVAAGQDREIRNIHSFTTHGAGGESGCVLPTAAMRDPQSPFYNYVKNSPYLVKDVPYEDGRIPDLPPSDDWAAVANSYGDFDNGIANSRDGAYLNKPDEGNFHAAMISRYNTTKFYRSGYFYEPWRNSDDWRSGVYMTPNRMVSSPVMFGSLPTGVWPGGAVATNNALKKVGFTDGKPWQTLLFHPYARVNGTLGQTVVQGHPGDNNPRDHYLLDLFFMPVVEPYAISEPLSVAGRLNLNYQIVPFTNITRATGMHALMKGEFMTTIPNPDVNNAKNYQQAATSGMWSSSGDRFWDESNSTNGRKFWHRPIDVTKTLYQFEQKFRHTATGSNHAAARYRGLFRSPSQICEIHLIPDVRNQSSGEADLTNVRGINDTTSGTQLQTVMDQFWLNHAPTGDNTRERPYSNLYNRVTTRGNTFRVHMRAQVIRTTRSTAVDTVDPVKTAVLSEYRGSSLVERYIDPTDASTKIPDYAASTNPLSLPPLETFYKFRTLESKRFSP